MTSFAVAREALAGGVARVALIAPGRATIPIIGCALLEASDEGLFVTATDLDIMYREMIDADVRDPWRACVDAVRLDAFVGGAPADGDITLRADDEGRLTIRSGRASCRLPTWPAEDFPPFHRRSEGVTELAFDAAALAAGLRAVAPAMNSERGRYYLSGAFLHSGRLCATDTHILTLATVATDTPPAPDVIVPGSTVTRLAALLRGLEGPLSVAVSQTQIIVDTPSWCLTSKVVDATFPDYQRLLPERSPSPLLVRREALRNAAALVVGVRHGDKACGLRLAAAGGELLVASAGDDALGACEITVPIESEPPAAASPVLLNPRYLLSVLDVIDAELVELHVADPRSAVWLCASGEAHDGSVIMPMRPP